MHTHKSVCVSRVCELKGWILGEDFQKYKGMQ